jgi:hypothetical protein
VEHEAPKRSVAQRRTLAFYGRSGGTISVTYTTKELTPATWVDFERMFASGRSWSFCACMLYQRGCHLDVKRFPDRASSLAQNQSEKRALVDAGRAHGILVYDDREPIGWCQFGPAEELPLPAPLASTDASRPWALACAGASPASLPSSVSAGVASQVPRFAVRSTRSANVAAGWLRRTRR